MPEKTIAPSRSDKKKKRSSPVPVQVLARHAVEAVLSKKGHDVVVMDMRGVSGVADYFVLCTGDSDLQIKAIADAVEMQLRENCQERPWHREGYEHRQWVLIDYVDLVVHIFNEEKRAFYDLERLWGDAPSERVAEEGTAAEVALLDPARQAPEGSPSPEGSTPEREEA